MKQVDALEARLGDISDRQQRREDWLKKLVAASIASSSSAGHSKRSSSTGGSRLSSIDELFVENADLKAQLAEKQEMVETFKKEMDEILAGLRKLEAKEKEASVKE